MGKKRYTIASIFPEASVLGRASRDIRETLRANNVSFKQPNLGDHVTYVAPFLLEESTACWLAKGLHIGNVFASESDHCLAEIDSCSFLGENNEAFVILLKTTRDFRRMVEYLRTSIPYGDWVYPPDRFSLYAHATIAEAAGNKFSFKKEVETIDESTLNRVVPFGTMVRFDPPKVYEKKDNGKWAPVHF